MHASAFDWHDFEICVCFDTILFGKRYPLYLPAHLLWPRSASYRDIKHFLSKLVFNISFLLPLDQQLYVIRIFNNANVTV